MTTRCIALLLALGGIQVSAADRVESSPPVAATASLNAYFEHQVGAIEGQLEREVKSKEDWGLKKDQYRRELAEMLGVDMAAPRTDLKATRTGQFEHEGIIVENLHYQSLPG